MRREREIEYSVRLADWERDLPGIRRVREQVFIVEQRVDPEEEWDEVDASCLHVIAATAAGEPIGTGRLDDRGKIGRMAVLKDYRGGGVGASILGRLLDEAERRGLAEVYLHAQTHALEFYGRFGFRTEGEEFMEADIPHYRMRRALGGGR